MQFEEAEAQRVMWTKLNVTMMKHRFYKPNFKGFMANNTQFNWNAVKMVYDLVMQLLEWWIRSEHACSIGFNHWISTPNN
jgi:hypothetical protein